MADDEVGDGYVGDAPAVAPAAHQGCELLPGEDQFAAESVGKASAATEAVADADEFQLGNAFYDAFRTYHKMLKESDESPEQEKLDKLSAQLKAIAWRVDKLNLFSKNEELDDINTGDLKFLLVPFLLGEVAGATQDMAARLKELRAAVVYWRTFAQHCERLHVIDAEDLKALGRAPSESPNANVKREEKIARYRRSKELDQKVAWLFKKKRAAAGDEFSWGHAAFDEDLERDLILSILSRSGGATAEQVDSAEQELPMLEMMMKNGGPGVGPSARSQEFPAEKPWVLKIQDKAALQQLFLEQVFQPDIMMPTMSLAEAADIEMDQIQEKQQREATKAANQFAYEDDKWWRGDRYGAKEWEEDYGEAKTLKDRAWDDWKDEHPFGSGNKMANVS